MPTDRFLKINRKGGGGHSCPIWGASGGGGQQISIKCYLQGQKGAKCSFNNHKW